MIRDRRGSELLFGLDVGTSSTKGVLARLDGEVVASAERFHRVSSPRPGWAEHDAEEVWWREFKEVCAGLLEEVDGRVVAVCVSGIGPCFVATGEGGHPLRPAILYGIDTRATREIEELTDMFGFANIVERCGNALTSQSTGPKIAWLRRTEPEVWKRTLLADGAYPHRVPAHWRVRARSPISELMGAAVQHREEPLDRGLDDGDCSGTQDAGTPLAGRAGGRGNPRGGGGDGAAGGDPPGRR